MLARIRKAQTADEGFTLIELLVVIVIIGILAAVAIPTFIGQRKKAVESGMKSDLNAVAQGFESFYVDAQTYVTTVSTSGNVLTIAAAGSAAAQTVRISTGNTIILGATAPTATTFCLKASNTAANSDWYFSNTGGLSTTAC